MDKEWLNINFEYSDISFKESVGEITLEILKKSNDDYELGILMDSEDSIYSNTEKVILKNIKFNELVQLKIAINKLVERIEIDFHKDV